MKKKKQEEEVVILTESDSEELASPGSDTDENSSDAGDSEPSPVKEAAPGRTRRKINSAVRERRAKQAAALDKLLQAKEQQKQNAPQGPKSRQIKANAARPIIKDSDEEEEAEPSNGNRTSNIKQKQQERTERCLSFDEESSGDGGAPHLTAAINEEDSNDQSSLDEAAGKRKVTFRGPRMHPHTKSGAVAGGGRSQRPTKLMVGYLDYTDADDNILGYSDDDGMEVYILYLFNLFSF